LKASPHRAIIKAERTATMRTLTRLLVVLCPLAAAPAWADTIYKWVDEQGTVHYSNARPAKPSQKAEVVVEDRVSTIQAAPAFAPAAASRPETEFLARRVDRLERELAAQRQAAQAVDTDARAEQAAYDRCRAERRIDCDGGYGPAPYLIVTAPLVAPRRHVVRNARFHSIRGVTGVTAGNVVTFRTPISSRTGRRFR
jgi:Domain of unknown function (DUF4124)